MGSIEIINDRTDLIELRTIPIRDHNDYYKLNEIIFDEKNKINKEVNLLFTIRKVICYKEIYF